MQSARGLASCDAESSRDGEAGSGLDAVPAGTNWQMHMPGGRSIGGSIRSSTNARSIAFPLSADSREQVNHIDWSKGASTATPGRREPSGRADTLSGPRHRENNLSEFAETTIDN